MIYGHAALCCRGVLDCGLLEYIHTCAGQASLFTMSADNAMVQFISRGAPRILESQVALPTETWTTPLHAHLLCCGQGTWVSQSRGKAILRDIVRSHVQKARSQ